MSATNRVPNRVKALRLEQGLTQADLARRAGISRTAISAIEQQQLSPSVTTAMALASILGCRVESLFGDAQKSRLETMWAWQPPARECRFWEAEVAGRTIHYPVEAAGFWQGHDGVWDGRHATSHGRHAPQLTLVVATCDPAAPLLAQEFSRTSPYRLLVIPRASRKSLEFLRDGLVHVAGVHLASGKSRRGNAEIVKSMLGSGYRLIHVVTWEAGVAMRGGGRTPALKSIARDPRKWVGRQIGSGARACQDELLGAGRAPKNVVPDHAAVAAAVRDGLADYGICLRVTAENAGLQFVSVRKESYDFVIRESELGDQRIRALVRIVTSASYRQLISELPGYDAERLGETSGT
jgi:molybdate-binding protein/DNA-binding XRE family transcriptional regulator